MTKVAERSVARYAATLYHDSVDNAADDDRFLGYFSTLAKAVEKINENREDPATGDEGWYTGGVQRGDLYPPVFGVRPERFESDPDASWYVGTDGKADR